MESVSDTAPITADAVEWAEARRMTNAIQTLARKRAEKAMHAKGSLLHSTNSQGQHGGSPLRPWIEAGIEARERRLSQERLPPDFGGSPAASQSSLNFGGSAAVSPSSSVYRRSQEPSPSNRLEEERAKTASRLLSASSAPADAPVTVARLRGLWQSSQGVLDVLDDEQPDEIVTTTVEPHDSPSLLTMPKAVEAPGAKHGAKQAVQTQSEVRNVHRARLQKRAVTQAIVCLVWCALYFGTGCAYYMAEEGWDVWKSLYFLMVTASTVGYGDVYPTTPWSRAFTIFYIVFGICIVFAQLSSLISKLFSPLFEASREFFERIFPQKGIDIDGDGTADFKVPRPPLAFYSKNLFVPALIIVTIQCCFSAVFSVLEGWDFGLALYHCLVTATTVGYGDVRINTSGGHMWAFFHIVISVSLLAAIVGDVNKLRRQRSMALAKLKMFRSTLDLDMLRSLDKDQSGVDKFEFVIGMMDRLGVIDMDNVRLFTKLFESMDKDGSGVLTEEDMVAGVKGRLTSQANLPKAISEEDVGSSVHGFWETALERHVELATTAIGDTVNKIPVVSPNPWTRLKHATTVTMKAIGRLADSIPMIDGPKSIGMGHGGSTLGDEVEDPSDPRQMQRRNKTTSSSADEEYSYSAEEHKLRF